MVALIALYALCASMFTISKWGLVYAQPIFFVAVRMILAGTLLCGYVSVSSTLDKKLVHSVKKDWFLFAQIILFHIYVTYLFDVWALKDITSSESAFIYNLSPFVAALCSYLFFSEVMTLKKWVGLGIGFAAYLPQMLAGEQGALVVHAWPRLLTLIAVVSSTYGWIVVRALVKKGYSPVFVNGVGMFFGGILALATSYATEPFMEPVTAWVPFAQATLLIVVVANVLFYNFYGLMLRRYTATFLSFAGFMCPFFASLFGYLFLQEPFELGLLVPFFFVCIGLALFYHEELKQGYVLSND